MYTNEGIYLGDNCIQIFHLGRYIVGYTVGNFVLRRRVSGAVKRNFRPYIRRYTSPNEKFEYSYPHSNALLIKTKLLRGNCSRLACEPREYTVHLSIHPHKEIVQDKTRRKDNNFFLSLDNSQSVHNI